MSKAAMPYIMTQHRLDYLEMPPYGVWVVLYYILYFYEKCILTRKLNEESLNLLLSETTHNIKQTYSITVIIVFANRIVLMLLKMWSSIKQCQCCYCRDIWEIKTAWCMQDAWRGGTITFKWIDFFLWRASCKLAVISNICLETSWHINKSKLRKQNNNNNSIDHSAAALDGGENSQ